MPSLEQIASQLITQAQGAGGKLQLDNSVIQSDCYADVLDVLALPKGVPVQVDAGNPAANIFVQNNTLFVQGTGTAYGGTLTGFELQLVGEDEPTRTAQVKGALSTLNLNQLYANQLVSNASLAQLIPSLPFPNMTLLAQSAPAGGGQPQMTLGASTSDNEWPILPDLGIIMTGLGAALTRTSIVQTLTLTGDFTLGSKQVSISLSIPAASFVLPIWTIGLDGTDTGIIDLADLSTLLAGTNVFEQLPGDMTAVGSFGLKAMQVSFTPTSLSASTVQQVMVNFGTTKPWPIVDNFTINTVGAELTVLNPFTSASRRITAVIYGSLQLATSQLDITMKLPFGGSDWVLNASGQLDLSNLSEFESLPGGYNTSQMNLPADVSAAALVLNYFTVSWNPTSKQLSFITFSAMLQATWWIIDQQLGFQNPMLTVYIPGASLKNAPPLSGSASGLLLLPDDVILSLGASYTKGGPWSFVAALAPGSQVNLIKLANYLLGSDTVDPDPSLNMNQLMVTAFSASVVSNPNPPPGKTVYALSATTVGSWDVTFGLLPPINFQADVAVQYDGTYTNIALGVPLDVFGVKFKVSYLLQNNKTQFQLDWAGFRFVYDKSQNTITSTVGDWTLGGIITALVNEIDPDLDFSLPDPWNLLNSISLKGLTLTLNLTDNTVSLTYKLTAPIKLFFINITGLSVSVENSSSVMIALEGTFLDNQPIPKWDAVNGAPPAVPGSGSDMFDLRLAAFGQHVTLAGVPQPATVQVAIDNYNKYIQPPKQSSSTVPVKAGQNQPVGTLVFDETSNWMIAADFTVAKFYTLQFVFNDPNLYGLRIAIAATAEYFKNLDFEIMYKKVSDSIGMYQVDLQLPDQFRHLEFGEVSITLPNIGVKVYTNGNFYLDFGFPASMTDFSRSFSVQVFPFVGYGGFYFGYLNGATSTNVPQTQYGQFNPVIEAGLGLSLGVGKTIDAGILTAGLSLTAVGIFQGVLGFYTCYADSSKTDTYYRFQATVALVGRIYGSVNFAIISAQFDITAYVSVVLTVEAYKPIPIAFQAGVSVSLTVKINLGLFKISISFKFSTTISASFVIGTDTSSQALWNNPCTSSARPLLRSTSLLLRAAAQKLVWQPLQIDAAQRPALALTFVPHLTVSSPAGKQQAEYVAMLYIDAPDPAAPSGAETSSLGNLACGILAWTISALLNSGKTGVSYPDLLQQTVTVDDLNLLLCVFNSQPNSAPPFNYANAAQQDARTFVQQFFSVNVTVPPTGSDQTMHAAVFPPFPELQLQTVYNGTASPVTDFAQQSLTGDQAQDYVGKVTAILKALGVSYETNLAAGQSDTDCTGVDNSGTEVQYNLSLPTFFLNDYMSLVAKSMLQNSLDYFTASNSTSATVGDLLTGVRTQANIGGLSGMASRFLLHGLRLPTPPVAETGAIAPFYVLTGQQVDLPPTLQTTDTYTIQFLKAAATTWIGFNSGGDTTLPITIDANEITRITQTAAVTMTPTFVTPPAPMVNFTDKPQAFTLGSPALWQYPGTYFDGQDSNPYLLKLPSNLLTEMAQRAGQSISFGLKMLDTSVENPTPQSVQHYAWGTAVSVTIQKLTGADAVPTPLQANMYNLIGTDDVGVSFLQDLVSYLDLTPGFAGTVQVLFQPDPTANSSGGYVSAANNTTTPPDQIALAIVQANLSTDTNPESVTQARALRGLAGAPPNTLNTFRDFVTLLWECSIVRSGGFYFYYNDVAHGSAGLSDALFDANGSARVQILITYPELVVQPFINSVVVGDAIDYSTTAVYAQTEVLQVRTATLQPGTLGYVFERNNPGDYNPTSLPPTPQQDEVYLENQFNLVGALLPQLPAYQNLLPSGPVDEMDPVTGQSLGDDAVWNYSGIIPFYQFAQTGSSVLYGFADPYVGIGTSPTIQLNWQDMFGNTLPFAAGQGTITQPLLYTDPLLAVSQWPSTSVGYAFTGTSAAPVVQLTFGFATARYQGDSSANNAAIDLQTWMRWWFQLQHAADLAMSFTVSIDGTQANPLGSVRTIELAQLQTQFVRPVIDYLYGVAYTSQDPTANPPAAYVISSAIDPATITTYTYIFALAVSITLSRTANVDPNFAQTPGVTTAVTAVQPLTAAGGSSATALTDFATQFESLFNTGGTVYLKVAAATNLSTASTTTTATPPLWIVRFDTSGQQGISVAYGRDQQQNALAAFFAPIPLATSLQSFGTTVYTYQTGQPYPGPGVTTNYTGIDLDNWGQQFLQAVDRFLTPAYAVPAFLLDNGVSLKLLLDAKQMLAEAITGTVDNIIESDVAAQANVRNAQEKWLQQLLIQLGSAYTYSAAVQTPVAVASCWTGPNNDPPQAGSVPRLYGQMVGFPPTGTGDTGLFQQEFALSTAKLPVGAGDSWLTYLFQCKDATAFASFPFGDMQFALTHLEWQYEQVDGIEGYLGSSWLALVLPPTIPSSAAPAVPPPLPAAFTDAGPVTVPVPLRAYPTPPSVTQQSAVNPSSEASQLGNDVLKARSWDYQFSYQASNVNQDTMAVQVQFNAGTAPSAGRGLGDPVLTLPQALGRFMAVYPAISADFDQYLTQVQAPATSGNAWEAVQAFIKLVQDVATTWMSWNQVNPLNPQLGRAARNGDLQDAPTLITLNYQVEESGFLQDAQELLLITVSADAVNPLSLLLGLDIPGYDRHQQALQQGQVSYTYTDATTQAPLLFADRDQVRTRVATAVLVDILNQQNGWAGAQIIRNQDLLQVPGSTTEWQVTNPLFIYQTPLVMFISQLAPLFAGLAPIDIAKLPAANGDAPAPRSLADNMAAFCAALTQQVTTTSIKTKVESQYSYVLPTGVVITLPVALALPFDLTTADQGQAFAANLAGALAAWQKQHQPSPAGGQWLFEVSIFSAYGAGPPMLRLAAALALAAIK